MSSHVEPNHGCYLMWCHVMSCHPMSCQVCHDMISISCHVTSLYVILYYFWLRLITSSHLLSVRDVVLNVSFFCRFWNFCRDVLRHHSAKGLLRCSTWKIRCVDSANHPKEGTSFPEGKVPSVARSDRYHFITLISKMIY